MDAILTTLWDALNSPIGIAAVAGLLLWLLNRLYAAKPSWKRFEGTIIAAVKYAEKAVPDDSDNKALNRLDAALRYVVRVYEQATGKEATSKIVADLKEGIQIKHAELESIGALSGAGGS